MNDAIRPCYITKIEKTGALVKFADGQDGYVPSVEFFWKWRRGADPSHKFHENQEIAVVPIRGHRENISSYSYKRANREPWIRTVESIRSAIAENPQNLFEVVGVIVSSLPDRVYVAVDQFEVDAVVTSGNLPLADFPAYANRPLNDFLFEGDCIRAVVESISEGTSEIFLSVLQLRERKRITNRRVTSLFNSNVQLQALWNRLEIRDEPTWKQFQEYGSDDRVAVVCDDEELKPAIIALLTAVGFAANSRSTPRELLEDPPDVIVLDVDRALTRGALADEIRLWTSAASEAKVVLLYSELTVDRLRQLRDTSSLYHGAVRKWFKPQQLLSSIRTALTASWQFDESQPLDGGAWRELAMQDAVDHERHRGEALGIILDQLQIGLGATAVALVQFNGGTRQTTLVAHAGLDRKEFDSARSNLDKSPVRDIVEDREYYRVTTGGEDAGFRYLYRIFPHHAAGPTFRSFLGMRLVDYGRFFVQTEKHDRLPPVAAPHLDGGWESYALLAFHREPQAFSLAGTQLFSRTAALLLAVLERDSMRRELVKFSEHMLVARQASFLLHEFRNRVSAVQTWNRLLEGDIKKLAGKRTILPNQVDQLEATCTNLNRVAAGLSQINEMFLNLSVEGRQSFRLGPLLDELRLVFREPLRDLNIHMETSVKWDEKITSNRGYITQILSNLIQNAIDQFRLAECQSPEIHISIEMIDKINGKTVCVTVSDNGIGIPRLHFGKIFEYNFTTKPEGSGIGLHVSRLIAESLRGSLVLDTSERFFQTRFVVTIPI